MSIEIKLCCPFWVVRGFKNKRTECRRRITTDLGVRGSTPLGRATIPAIQEEPRGESVSCLHRVQSPDSLTSSSPIGDTASYDAAQTRGALRVRDHPAWPHCRRFPKLGSTANSAGQELFRIQARGDRDIMTDLTRRLGSSNSAKLARAFAILAALAAAIPGGTAGAAATLDRAPYGTTQGGQAVDIFTMANDHGIRVRFLSYGGVITEIDVPDRAGRVDNIALGLRTLRDYETLPGHFGAITGRYANRIGGAQFTLGGQTYHLIANNGPNTLHGGPNALDRQVWTVSPTPAPDGVAATLSYVSKDGDQNFPGTLTTHVTYTLTNDDALRIDYAVGTDKDTVINFTNHSYFNLAGNGSGSVADQLLLVNADRYTPTGPDQIPTGEIAPVEGTPLDFRQMMPIGARLHSAFPQMVFAHGYDHNWVLNKREGDGLTFAARGY